MSYVSTIEKAPTSYFVYSSLSAFATLHDGELSGTWLVSALADAKRSEPVVRQTLFRMERDGELESRRSGREKWYRPSPYARAEIDAGRRKLLERNTAASTWDGKWTIVVTRFTPAERKHRDRVRSLLDVEGFASVTPGVFIHPRDRASRLRKAAHELAVSERIHVFHGALEAGPLRHQHAALAGSLWDLGLIARGYRDFVRRYERYDRRPPAAPRDAFLLRFAVVFDYLEIAWRDPELPVALLPRNWPARAAHSLARRLYQRLLPAALRHARSRENR